MDCNIGNNKGSWVMAFRKAEAQITYDSRSGPAAAIECPALIPKGRRGDAAGFLTTGPRAGGKDPLGKPDPIFVWTAESQRVLFETEHLDAAWLHKDAGRAWRRHTALSSTIEQTSAMPLAGSAARIELAQRDDNLDFEGFRDIERAGR
jgi:hypothetical protein